MADLKVVLSTTLEANEEESAKRIVTQLPSIEKIVNSQSKVKLMIDIAPIQLQNQVQAALNNAQTVAKTKAINLNVGLDDGSVSKVRSELQSLKVDDNITKEFTSQLDTMGVQIDKVRAQFVEVTGEENRLLQLQIQGTDQLGRSVSILQRYDTVYQKLHTIVTGITSNYEKQRNEQEKLAAQVAADYQKRLDFINKEEIALRKLQATYTGENSVKPVKNSSNLEDLKKDYDTLLAQLNTLKDANQAFSEEEIRNITKSISLLSEKIKKYQNLEYVATSLRTKSAAQVNTEQLEELNAYEEKLKSGGILTQNFQAKIVRLRQSLTSAFDRSSITQYLDEFGKLQTEVDALREKLRSVSKIYSQLISVNNKITSTQAQIKQLEVTGDSNLLSEKQNELALYERQQNFLNAQLSAYSDILDLSSQKVKYEQQSEVNQQKIRNVTAQVVDEQEKLAAQTEIFAAQLNRAKSNLEAYGKSNSALFSSSNFTNQYNTLLGQLDKIKTPDELRKWNVELSTFKNNVKTAGLATLSFGDTIKNAFAKFSYWLSVTTIIMSAIRAIKEMISNVVELDTAMTELKKVTDEVDAVYNGFLDKAAEKAKKIGTTMTDYVNATSDFARLGYSLGDAEYLAEVATIYSVVGDDINNIDDATSSIISTMKAFKIEARDSMTIVDKFNEVGNKFAISSGGIGDALTRSAAALYAAGNTIDESIALIVAANNVIQDPSSVGTMWKTVSMRIRGAKTELEEAGLETEGIAVSTSRLRDTILAITNIDGLGGFDILTDSGAFKSTYDIIQGIAKVWEDIGKVDPIGQAGLLELLAGKRQGNALAAAMTNMGEAAKVYETSINSLGSAEKEHEKWLESVEAKTKQFQAAWESLSSVMVDSGSINFVVDSGTTLLGIIENLVKALGGLEGILVIILGIIATMNADDLIKLSGTMLLLGKNILFLIPNLITTVGLFREGRASGLAFGDALKMAGVSANTAQLAIGALTAVLSVAIIIIQSCIQKHDEMVRAAISAAEALKEETQQLDDYKKRIIELRKDLDSGNKSYEDAKSIREELYDIQDKLIGQYGSEATAIDTVTDSIESQIEEINKLGESSWRKYVQENQKAIQESIDFFDKQPYGTLFKFTEYNQLNNSGENIFGWVLDKNALQENNEFIAILKNELSDISNLDLGNAERYFETITQNVTPKEELEILREVFDTIEKVAKERYGANYLDYVSNMLGDVSADISKIQEEINTKAPAYDTYIEGLVKYESEFSSIYSNLLTNKQKLDVAYSSNNFEQITDAYQELLKSLDDAYDASSNSTSDYANDILSYFKGLFPNVEKEYEDFINSSVKSGEKVSDANAEVISSYSNIVKVLKAVQTEADKTGKVSSSSYQKVIALGEDYTDLFDYSEGVITLNQEALEKLISSLNNEYSATLASNGATDDQISVLESLSKSLFKTSNSYDDIIDNIDSLIGILEKVNSGYEYSTLEILDLIYQYPELAAGIEETTEGYKLQETAVLNLVKAKAKLLEIQNTEAVNEAKSMLTESAGNSGTADKIGEVFDSYKDKYGEAISSWDNFVTGWEDFWHRSAEGVNWVDGVQDYVEAMINQTNVTEWADKIISDMQNGVVKQGKSSSSASNSTKSEDPQWLTDFKAAYDEWNHLVDMGEKTQVEYINWLDKAYKAAFLNDTAKKYVSDMWKYEEEVYKDRQSIVADSLKATQDNIDEYIDHIDELYKKHQDESEYIGYLSDVLKTYGNVLSDTQRANVMSKLSTAQTDYFDNLITDIEHEIYLLERETDTEQERITLYQKAQDVLLEKKKYYLEQGYSETSEELQKIEREYNSLADNISNIMESAFNNMVEKQKSSVEGMINNINDSESAINKVLDTVVNYIKRQKNEEIDGLNDQIDALKDSYNAQKDATEQYYDNQIDAVKDYYDEQIDAANNHYDEMLDSAKNRYDDMIKVANTHYDEQIDTAKEAYETQRIAQESYYENLIESTEDASDAQIKTLEDQIDKYKELIDTKKNLLQATRDEEKFNDEILDRNKDISSLQFSIDLLSMDDSTAARAKRLELEEELAKQQKELSDYQADYSLDKQLDALDNELGIYEEAHSIKMNLIKAQTEAVVEAYENQKEEYLTTLENEHTAYIESLEAKKKAHIASLEAEKEAYIETLEVQKTAYIESLEAQREARTSLLEMQKEAALTVIETEYNASVTKLEAQIEDIRSYLEKEGTLRRDANALLEKEGEALWNKLMEYEYEYSEDVKNIQDAWDTAKDAISRYNNGQLNVIQTLGQMLSLLEEYNHQLDVLNNTTYSSLLDNTQLASEYNNLFGADALTYNNKNNESYLNNIPIYHNGGIVGGVKKRKDSEVLSLLENNEMVLDEPKKEALYEILDDNQYKSYLADKWGTSTANIDKFHNIRSLHEPSVSLTNTRFGLSKELDKIISNIDNKDITIEKMIDVHVENINEASLKDFGELIDKSANEAIRRLNDGLKLKGIRSSAIKNSY